MKSEIVRARINGPLKHEVEDILSDLGLTMSDAINILFKQIQLNHGLPFKVKIPNKVTRKTLENSAKGKNMKKFNSVDELFDDLNK